MITFIRFQFFLAKIQFTIESWMTFENITKRNFKSLKNGLIKLFAKVLQVPEEAVVTKIPNPLGRQKLQAGAPVTDVDFKIITMDENDARNMKDSINKIEFKPNLNKKIKDSKSGSEEEKLKNATVVLLSTTKAIVDTKIG